MGPSTMAVDNNADFEEVYMDPELALELFGSTEMYPGIIQDLFSCHLETDDIPSSSNPSKYSSAPFSSTRASTPTSDFEDKDLTKQCFDRSAALAGSTSPKKLVKTSAMLDREATKMCKLEKRDLALKKAEIRKQGNIPTDSGAAKRRHSDDDENMMREAKRGRKSNVDAGILQQVTAPTTNDVQERKRGSDQEEPRQSTKRRRASDVDAEILRKGEEAKEKHLAPAFTEGVKNLAILNTEDEMTAMLEAELAHTVTSADDEPEDPRVEEILQPLTAAEKLQIARFWEKLVAAGSDKTTIEWLRKMVEMALKTRVAKAKNNAAKGGHVPKKSSPLATNGVGVEGEETERRKKIAPRSRKGSFNAIRNATSTPAAIKNPCIASIASGGPTPAHTITSAPPAALSTANEILPAQHATYDKLKVSDLRKICEQRGLTKGGNKPDLLRRLQLYDVDLAAGKTMPPGLKMKGKGGMRKERYSAL